ncbi:MAG: GWxTD domain-containing protein [Acidobacteriota bacterium]
MPSRPLLEPEASLLKAGLCQESLFPVLRGAWRRSGKLGRESRCLISWRLMQFLLFLSLLQLGSLSEPHRAWLEEEVHFLISSRERSQFLKLESDRGRDRFIEEFWRRRDPTPGTVRNEARERHLALLAEADRLFTLVGSRRGRFTDRGRIYQLLGPPQSREDFARAGNRLYPLELWLYTGVTERFLPDSFYLIFFRQGGFADYRLWRPATDGPQTLTRLKDPGRLHLQDDLAFEELEHVDLELAMAAARLIPGEADDLPAFAAESLLTNLREYADTAERNFRLRERVTAEATFKPLQASLLAVALQDSTGVPQLHYALEVPSKAVRWVAEGDRRRTSFTLNTVLLDPSGREVDRIEDALDLEVSSDEKAALEGVPLSFQGRLIVVPGSYTLEMTLRNTTGGGIDTQSVPVVVREDRGVGCSDLLLARSFRVIPGGELLEKHPFQLGDVILSPAPDRLFPATQALAYLQLWGLTGETTLHWGLFRGEQALWETKSRVSPAPQNIILVQQVIPLESIPDGVYTLRSRFLGTERRTELRLARERELRSVRVLSREGFPAGHGRIRFQRGVLFARLGDAGRAIDEMTEAAELLPRDLEVHLRLAFLLNVASQYERVLELLKPLAPHFPNQAELFVFLGFASLKLGQYAEAVAYYEKALVQRPDDERLASALERARKLTDAASRR